MTRKILLGVAVILGAGETAATYQADGGVGPAAGPRVLDAMG